jgi:TonB family protein
LLAGTGNSDLFAVAGIALFLDDSAARRAVERRLSIAVGTSFLIHAIAIALLRGLVPGIYADASGGTGSFALQAMLAGPAIEAAPEEALPVEPTIDRDLLLPPMFDPREPAIDRAPSATAPLPGRSSAPTGQGSPDLSIAVGTIDDPARVGQDYVTQLAQRFPERAQKVPLLLGTPVVVYPPTALERGAEGRVAVLLTLDAEGKIVDSKLITDASLFSSTVLEALKDVNFAPAEIDGKPVAYWSIVEFVFLIGRPGDVARAAPRVARKPAAGPRQPSVGR